MGTKCRGRRSAATNEERAQYGSSNVGFEMARLCFIGADAAIKSKTVSEGNIANSIYRTCNESLSPGREGAHAKYHHSSPRVDPRRICELGGLGRTAIFHEARTATHEALRRSWEFGGQEAHTGQPARVPEHLISNSVEDFLLNSHSWGLQ